MEIVCVAAVALEVGMRYESDEVRVLLGPRRELVDICLWHRSHSVLVPVLVHALALDLVVVVCLLVSLAVQAWSSVSLLDCRGSFPIFRLCSSQADRVYYRHDDGAAAVSA
jgi:hypothetical protein